MLKEFPDEKRTLHVSHRVTLGICGKVNLINCTINRVGVNINLLWNPVWSQFRLFLNGPALLTTGIQDSG